MKKFFVFFVAVLVSLVSVPAVNAGFVRLSVPGPEKSTAVFWENISRDYGADISKRASSLVVGTDWNLDPQQQKNLAAVAPIIIREMGQLAAVVRRPNGTYVAVGAVTGSGERAVREAFDRACDHMVAAGRGRNVHGGGIFTTIEKNYDKPVLPYGKAYRTYTIVFVCR